MPKQKASPKRGKVPREASAQNLARQTFIWRVTSVDMAGQWGWGSVDLSLLFAEVIPKLHEYESMTWADVEGPSGSHFVACDGLCRDAQSRLQEISLDDVEELFSLRITGRRRVWGIRDGRVLQVLWWDPNHEVCPSEKKNS